MSKSQPWDVSDRSAASVRLQSIQQKMRPLLIVFSIYLTAAIVYTIYTGEQGTGLTGYVMKVELDFFGHADIYWTIRLMIFGWALAFVAIAMIVWKSSGITLQDF
jgi:hypothetical protein